ncbi:MAG TPA: glucosamine-6-phosphate deaminase, partial [Devosiaceae bacterium]|nr:glucosamine-6-phosphate deaminase [Devosiaceae bacterium]
MQVEVLDQAEAVERRAAAIIAETVNETPGLVLGLPAGRTPVGIYRELVRLTGAGAVSFKAATVFVVDEYVGLAPDAPGSFTRFVREHLVDHVDLPPDAFCAPDGAAPDPDAEAARYQARIEAAGGIDLLVLGVGANGHIGFNEPGSTVDSVTRVVTLDPATTKAGRDSLSAGAALPTRGITIGIDTVLTASAVLLVATGAAKAEAVRQLMAGEESVEWPVTALTRHPYVSVLLDKAAAGQNFTI